MALENIAEKLARTTITPTPDVETLGQIGKGISTGIRKEVEPFLAAEKKDVITGEFAKSPFRLQLAKQTGVKRWADISDKYEKVRNEFLNWTPGKVQRVPKTKTVSTEFNRDVLRAIPAGKTIDVGGMKIQRRTDGGYAFKLPGQNWIESRAGLNKNITSRFGTQIQTTRAIPGQFEEKAVGAGGRAREDIKKEMDEIAALYNRIVPGKSELQAYLAYLSKLKKAKGRGAGADKWQLEKLKAMERAIGDIRKGEKGVMAQLQREVGDIPFTTIRGYYADYLHDINFNLTPSAIRRGQAAKVKNATLNSFKLLDENLVDQHLNQFQKDINKNVGMIGKMEKESDKLIASYALLLRMAPLAGDPARAVTGAVGDSLLLNTLQKAGVNPATEFEDGILSLPRYQDDYNNMTGAILAARGKNFKTPIAEKGRNVWEANLANIRKFVPSARLPKWVPVFQSGTTPDNIIKVVRDNVLHGDISKLAPRTRAEWDNPLKTQQKWKALYRSAFGRVPVFADTKEIETPEEERARLKKQSAEATAEIRGGG